MSKITTKQMKTIIFYLVLLSLGIVCNNCKKDNDTKPEKKTATDTTKNINNTITIGTQVWMAENLKVTKFRDGDPIPNVTDSAAWSNLTTPAYCWYNNDEGTYRDTYGALYNWY